MEKTFTPTQGFHMLAKPSGPICNLRLPLLFLYGKRIII